jgi:hypothetical protein
MIYLLTGNDDGKKNIFLREHRATHFSDMQFRVYDEFDFSIREFEANIAGEDLFGERTGFILKNILSTVEVIKNVEDVLMRWNPQMPIYVLEKSVPKDFLESFLVEEYAHSTDVSIKPDFTLFQAIYARDKKGAWTSFVKRSQAEPAELLHGSILSQIKNMYKVKHLEGGYKELGFTTDGSYQAARRGTSNYTSEEISDMYHTLVAMPTEARTDNIPLSLMLERFILKL